MLKSAYFIPTINLFGQGSVNDVGTQVKTLGGKKVLIVTDVMLAKLGMADKVKDIIVAAGLECVIFNGAEPNPTDLDVEAAFEAWTKNSCDAIVSLGGGSSHDVLKVLDL